MSMLKNIKWSRSVSFLLVMLLVGLAGLAAGCGGNQADKLMNNPPSQTYYMFDTIVNVRVYDERVSEEHFDEIGNILARIDQEMNRQLEGSEIAKVNQQAGQAAAIEVSEETIQVVQTALGFAESSGGSFDPTVGPIVDLWGIGSENAAVPDSETLVRKLELVDYTAVLVDDTKRTIQLTKGGMAIDLGAIAKGYAADVIADYLRDNGFTSAIIDLGGNILVMGRRPDGSPWTIGVQTPSEDRGQHLGSLKVADKTVVTSGVYERFFKDNGKVYHHILDTKNGYPVENNLLSVTIVAELSIDADALSTTVFSLGLEEGIQYIESRGDAEAIFVTTDKEIIVTSGLAGQLHLTNEEYRLVTG